MLIKVSDNNREGVSRFKNPIWEQRGITPNEAYAQDPEYRALAHNHKRHNGFKSPMRWVEARVVDEKISPLVLNRYDQWYQDPVWMEQVFWVYAEPLTHFTDGEPYQYYCLEAFECYRVYTTNAIKYNGKPNRDPRTGFIVPVECCHLAWTETSAGISDHIHHRPDAVKSQEQIDFESNRDRIAGEIMKEATAVSSSGDLENLMSQAAEQGKVLMP
jgi:hypothetical protein